MRIIGGHKKGIILHAPAGLPVRPTTDRAKESLFNILSNRFEFDELLVLDLFAGTGNMSYEFSSRGALVLSVDQDQGCVRFMKDSARKLNFQSMEVRKADVFSFLKSTSEQFHIIFADPPYALNRLSELPDRIFERNLLKPGGLLIIEHASQMSLSAKPYFTEERKYGQSAFSFFELPESEEKS